MTAPEDRIAERGDSPLSPYMSSWLRSMKARNLSTSTLRVYVTSICTFDEFLAEDGHSRVLKEIDRAEVERFIADLHATGKTPATVNTRYRSLQQFFKWALEEEEIGRDPMERMKSVIVPVQPVPVVSEADLSALLKSLGGKSFLDRRDNAIVRLFLDTGLRRSELAGIQIADIDLDTSTVVITGKGRRMRQIRYGTQTTVALDRYARVRGRQPTAHLSAFWLSADGKGPATHDGIYQMLTRRARNVGLNVHPHQLRHSWAHYFLAAGGNETDLMFNAGWKSRQMLNRYGASAGAERAREAAARFSLGDRL